MLQEQHRLRNRRDFRRVYSRGRSHIHPTLVLNVLPTGSDSIRFGFSVSKKLGHAVERNRIKRRLREACRARLSRLCPGFDVVFVARSRMSGATFERIQSAVDDLLQRARLVVKPNAPEGIEPCGESAPL